MLRSALIVVLATAACRAEPASDQQEPSESREARVGHQAKGHVIDQADVLQPMEERRLTQVAVALQETTGDHLVIVTVRKLGQESMEHLSWALAGGLGLGEKNGVLMIVAPEEKRVRIAVGKGLNGLVTDVRSADVVASMMPALEAGHPGQAIAIGEARIDALLRSDTRRPQRKAA